MIPFQLPYQRVLLLDDASIPLPQRRPSVPHWPEKFPIEALIYGIDLKKLTDPRDKVVAADLVSLDSDLRIGPRWADGLLVAVPISGGTPNCKIDLIFTALLASNQIIRRRICLPIGPELSLPPPIDPETGLAITDPETGKPISGPVPGLPRPPDLPLPPSVLADPASGLPILDPHTGLPVGPPSIGQIITDPRTGLPVDGHDGAPLGPPA